MLAFSNVAEVFGLPAKAALQIADGFGEADRRGAADRRFGADLQSCRSWFAS